VNLNGRIERPVWLPASVALHPLRVPLASVAHVAMLAMGGKPDGGIPSPDGAVVAFANERG